MGSIRLRQGPLQHCLIGIYWRSILLSLVVGIGLLAAAPGAEAALGISGGVITYNARSGDANDIQIAFNGIDYTVADSVPIDAAADASCIVTGNTATCPGAGVTGIRVNAGNLDDHVTIDRTVTVPAQLFGREGNDVLTGGSGDDTLNGSTGDDMLVGNDGFDTADYSGSPAGTSIVVDLIGGTIVGVGSDRLDPGAKSTIEKIRGTAGDDTINSRNRTANVIVCGNGQDFVNSDAVDTVSTDCEDNNDGVAPATQVTAGPEGPTTNSQPSFEFVAPDHDPLNSVQCWIANSDYSTPTDCESPFETPAPLADGDYRFSVIAIDKYNNARSASRDFTVDTVAPDTVIDSTPGAVAATSTPTFAFSSDDPAATFACRFDASDFVACGTPFTGGPLANGPHTFEVVARDAAGNQDQTPAAFSFTVAAAVPVTQPVKTAVVGSIVLISGRSVKLVKGRLIPVTVTCAGLHACKGKVAVRTEKAVSTARKGRKHRRRVLKLGSKSFSIPGNKRMKVLVPLAKSKAKLLRRLRRVKVRATIREVDLQGRPRISSRAFMLRAR